MTLLARMTSRASRSLARMSQSITATGLPPRFDTTPR